MIVLNCLKAQEYYLAYKVVVENTIYSYLVVKLKIYYCFSYSTKRSYTI